MTPYYERDGITIYHGDCREVLPTLEPGSVDLLLTDPPYGIAYSTGRRAAGARSIARLAYDLATAPLLNDAAVATAPLLNDAAAATAPLLNDAAHIYWFAAPDRLDTTLPVVRSLGRVVNVLAWDKGNCTAGDLAASYGKQWEAVVFARRARRPLVGRRDRDVLRYSRGNTSDYHHPTQKPLPLLRYLIGRHEASTILDPFAGSGSTLLAAKELGRRAIGIELEERFCEVAAKRLEAAA